MPTSHDLLTLSREDLYELVWSKPMTELAKDFGLSDVALAKRCRKLHVPVPGRGYWARVAAGQTPRQPKLKKRAEEPEDYTALTFDPPREESSAPPPTEVTEHSAFRERLQTLKIPNCENLRFSSAPVKRTAARLKRPWRNEISWNRGERKGPVVSVDVSCAVADRALLVADRLVTTAASVGWAFKAPPVTESPQTRPNEYRQHSDVLKSGCLYIEGEALTIQIDERRKRIDHVLTDSEKTRKRRGEYVYPPRWDYLSTGELRLTVARPEHRYRSKTWKDGKTRLLEDQINTILLRLFDEALKIKADREQRRLDEIERQRQEKLRRELSQRRAANATLINELEAQAGGWFRARFLRAYLRALKKAVGDQKLGAQRLGETVDFVAWAEHYVDQLDPLCPTPHDPDLKADRPGYYSPTDTKVHETLSHLLGRHWEEAFKLEPPTPDTELDTDSAQGLED